MESFTLTREERKILSLSNDYSHSKLDQQWILCFSNEKTRSSYVKSKLILEIQIIQK